jgi:hypothetical protein
MAWMLPPLPRPTQQSRIDYWRQFLQMPLSEPAAVMLRTMAAERLITLHAIDPSEARRYIGANAPH